MNQDRWKLLRTRFDQAMGLPRESRARFVDETCGDDEWLRAELARMFAEDGPATSFLKDPLALEAEPPSLELHEGDVLGEFELLRLIGQGGMGQVWAAKQKTLARTVALKVMRPDRDGKKFRELFQREARASGCLDHPAVVRVHATGVTDGVYWIAQELVGNGRTLCSVLSELAELPELPHDHDRKVATWLRDLAHGLHAVHENGVIHRDLKPQNVLVSEEGSLKVTDFGIAGLQGEATLIGVNGRAGTPRSMSPEQHDPERGAVDRRTDVFSFGSMIYELLTLSHPFGEESPLQVYENILNCDPAEPRSLRRNVPEELSIICMKALEKRPVDRYSTMEELAHDLERYLTDQPILASRPGHWKRMRKFGRRNRRRLLFGAASAVLVAAAVTLAIVFTGLSSRAEANAWNNVVQQVQVAVQLYHLEGAMAIADAADGMAGDDGTADLMLAAGLALWGKSSDASYYYERGLGKDQSRSLDGVTILLRQALSLVATREQSGRREAEKLLVQAHNLDRERIEVLMPLVMLRRVLGDKAGAKAALELVLPRLKPTADSTFILRSLFYELGEDGPAAIRILKRISDHPDMTQKRLRELRYHRALARCLIVAGEYEAAVEASGQAIQFEPDAGHPRQNLAIAYHNWCSQPGLSESKRGELKGLAEAAALEALQYPTHEPEPWSILSFISYERLIEGYQQGNPSEEDRIEFEERLAGLRVVDPDSETANGLEAAVVYREARVLFRTESPAESEDLLRKSLALDPLLYQAATLLGEVLLHDNRLEESLERTAEAIAAYDRIFVIGDYEEARRHRKSPRWMHHALVIRAEAAVKNGQAELALEAIGRIERDYHPEEDFEQVTLANYAGLLTLDRLPEVRDCVRALEVVAAMRIRATESGVALEQRVEDYLQEIEEKCSR